MIIMDYYTFVRKTLQSTIEINRMCNTNKIITRIQTQKKHVDYETVENKSSVNEKVDTRSILTTIKRRTTIIILLLQ